MYSDAASATADIGTKMKESRTVIHAEDEQEVAV
jgi:hypothetical protein